MADITGLLTELAAVDAKILAILTNIPDNGFDWSVGHVRFDNSSRGDFLKALQEHRDKLWVTMQHRCPVEVVEDIGHAIDQFGEEIIIQQ